MFNNPWTKIGFDSWMLGWESAAVIGMRSIKFAAGGAAAAQEAELMVREKMDAMQSLNWQAATGALGMTPARATANTIAHYRRKVGANHRRLSK